jgi:SnoaL-like protein
MESLTREQVTDWVSGYERAWRSPGTSALGELFAEEASYRMSPYEEAVSGLEAIGRLWEAEREGPDEVFSMASEIVAVEGDTAVVRVEVVYDDPAEREFRDLWLIRFGDDGRCLAFEEWPFWPGRGHSASAGPPG